MTNGKASVTYNTLLTNSFVFIQIVWDNRLSVYTGQTCLVSVDGTDFQIQEQSPFCQIQEQSPFWKGWYSHKFKGPGLRYEVGVCIATGDIVWVNGPYPAGKFSDLSIFCHVLKWMLLPFEMVEADAGYRGEPACVSDKTHWLTEAQKDQKDTVRARHETVN